MVEGGGGLEQFSVSPRPLVLGLGLWVWGLGLTIVWIKYLFLKVNDYIMMIGHKQIRLGLISSKIMHNYPRAYQRNCDKGEVRPHRCHWEGMSEKHLS